MLWVKQVILAIITHQSILQYSLWDDEEKHRTNYNKDTHKHPCQICQRSCVRVEVHTTLRVLDEHRVIDVQDWLGKCHYFASFFSDRKVSNSCIENKWSIRSCLFENTFLTNICSFGLQFSDHSIPCSIWLDGSPITIRWSFQLKSEIQDFLYMKISSRKRVWI